MKRVVVAAAVLALGACGGGGPSRADVLEPVMSDVVPARFEHFATTTAALRDNVSDSCDNGAAVPTQAVDQVLTEWYALKPFWSGPVMNRRSQFIVDFKADADGIAEALASEEPIDVDYLRDRVAANKRGLSALEVLLAEPPSPRRCDYALAIADLVALEALAVSDDWQSYGPTAVDGDAAANDAIRDIVSNATFALRAVEMDPPPAPEVRRGLLDGVRAAMLGLAPLLDDRIASRLSDELGREDAAAAELTLSVDVASDLGITLNFSDADGDG